MKRYLYASILLIAVALFIVATMGIADAQKKAPDTVTLQLEGAKLAPVVFSHSTHVEKIKLECAVCHHKDKNPQEPDKCTQCHLVKEVKDNAPLVKDALHKTCQTCHKESAAKGINAPTKCAECHKK